MTDSISLDFSLGVAIHSRLADGITKLECDSINVYTRVGSNISNMLSIKEFR